MTSVGITRESVPSNEHRACLFNGKFGDAIKLEEGVKPIKFMLLVYPVWRIAMPARIDLQSPSPCISTIPLPPNYHLCHLPPSAHIPTTQVTRLFLSHSFHFILSVTFLTLSLSLPPPLPPAIVAHRVLVFILLVARCNPTEIYSAACGGWVAGIRGSRYGAHHDGQRRVSA